MEVCGGWKVCVMWTEGDPHSSAHKGGAER
jgi:hypothetical protein